MNREEREGKTDKVTIEPFPSACRACTRQEMFGCGRDPRYAGRSRVEYIWGRDFTTPAGRTCPRYYAETDADVARVLWDLEDYTRGALGRIGRLPAPLVTYYRVAESERERWRDAQRNSD